MERRYYPLSEYLKKRFGEKVFKVTIDTGLTCPNRDGTKGAGGCVYCHSGSLKPKGFITGAGIREQLQGGIEYVRKRHRAGRFIAYFQLNTNTYASPEYLLSLYKEALLPEVAAVAVSTRPDCLEGGVLDVLSEIEKERPIWLELGLQSAHDETLSLINRGHTVKDFEEAVRAAQVHGIDVCAHVIMGLPGEDRGRMLSTIDFLAALGVWGVKFHQLQVLTGTRLHESYLKGEVPVLSLDEYSSLVVESLERLPGDTVIHRLCGDAPKALIAAPAWGVNKFVIVDRITGLFKERETFQGRLYQEAQKIV